MHDWMIGWIIYGFHGLLDSKNLFEKKNGEKLSYFRIKKAVFFLVDKWLKMKTNENMDAIVCDWKPMKPSRYGIVGFLYMCRRYLSSETQTSFE
jgi:hypothetical protein